MVRLNVVSSGFTERVCLVTGAGSAIGTARASAGARYTASKHVGLTRNVAWACADDGIRYNAILPGPVLTGVANKPPTFDQIAAVAMFLASDAAEP